MDEYKKIAAKLVSLKSVSADPQLKKECEKTAEFLKGLLDSYEFKTKTISGYGNPIVFGTYIVDPKLETCLIYGHYDVQPADKKDGWDNDPFKFVEKDGRFYGRGISDDKCEFLIHVLSIGKLSKEKKLGYNVKFLLEGEEEMGSPNIHSYITKYKKDLLCDFVFLSDGTMIYNQPTIELGNRGVVNATLTIKTSSVELHSGDFGGAAPNAIYELSKIISSLLDKNIKIAVEDFYDDVDKVDPNYKISFDMAKYKKISGTKALLTEPEYDFFAQTGLRPSFNITGIYGGHTGKGHKTVIPKEATAKLNFRIVKNQTPEKVAEILTKHFRKLIPDYVDYTFTVEEMASPNKTDINNKFVKRADKILKEVYAQSVIYRYVGGTEPALLYLQEELNNKPILSVALANDDSNFHGQNENFKIENIEKGFAFSRVFFSKNS